MDSLFPISFHQDPVSYAVPVFIIMILIESYLNYRYKLGIYESKDTRTSLILGIGSVILDLFVKAAFFYVFLLINKVALFQNIHYQWWAWLALFFLDDFTFYWFHRSMHSIRILWCAHSNHHSAVTLNWATALRQSWTELLFKNLFWLPIAFLGFPPLMIFTIQSTSLIYQFWPHTEVIKKMPRWFEFIFNTPSHHRVHHASNIRYLDRNHAGTLIIWDRMFGTFEEERDEEKPIYGITKSIESIHGNPLKVTVHEYVDLAKDIHSAKNLKDKINYLFKPPDWSHNGEDLTTETLRKKHLPS